MSRSLGSVKEKKNKVPSYIVTFSDMITLLLTFFVLLLSMAITRSEESDYKEGQMAFVKAISNFGLKGISFSKRSAINRGEKSVRYKVDKDEKFEQEKSLDMTEETVRRVFKELERTMKITPTQISGKSPDFRPTPISFKKGQAVLGDSDKKFLDNFAFNLQENIGTRSLILYVVGLAPKESSLQSQCMVSAKRAQTVSDYLYESLSENLDWKIHCWGAGPGGQWKKRGPIAESEIIIAVLGN